MQKRDTYYNNTRVNNNIILLYTTQDARAINYKTAGGGGGISCFDSRGRYLLLVACARDSSLAAVDDSLAIVRYAHTGVY